MYRLPKVLGYRGAGGLMLGLSEQVSFEVSFECGQARMFEGSELRVVAVATKKARHAMSVRVLGTVSSEASDDRTGRTGTAVWIRSLRYAAASRTMTP